jgi:hypothetical protein
MHSAKECCNRNYHGRDDDGLFNYRLTFIQRNIHPENIFGMQMGYFSPWISTAGFQKPSFARPAPFRPLRSSLQPRAKLIRKPDE